MKKGKCYIADIIEEHPRACRATLLVCGLACRGFPDPENSYNSEISVCYHLFVPGKKRKQKDTQEFLAASGLEVRSEMALFMYL